MTFFSSMSHDFHHHGIFSFSDHAPPDPPLAGVNHAPEPVYETAGMLSEMLNFGAANNNNNPAGMQFFLADPPPRSPATHALLPTQHHEFLNWVDPEGGNPRGLSLSLSSAKAEEEFRFNQNVMHLQGYGIGQSNSGSGHFGFGSTLTAPSVSLGAVNALRSSKFVKPTQELLEEFCSVGRGNLKKINKIARNDSISSTTSSGGGGPSSLNSGKDLPALTQSDRVEHQRRKVKLLAMLDEVERRYSQYCEQMQMVVNSYDVVMGYGAAIPYTALAQKAMSRHFRCLKDAIHAQLKHSCELLGDKDVSASTGLTKGETPRLKVLEQSLRQQRAFHQMGMMEQEAWRPQRGLPERSVNVLRAWLFEHFLNPYPSDADKHLLARQTGLSRNQVSNWFINARVRLWKPMVEDMYQQESKDDDQEDDEDDQEQEEDQARETNISNAQTSMSAKRPVISSAENDPSFFAIQAPAEFAGVWAPPAGDVSLTLGLRHSAAGGSQPEKSGFSFREFGS